MIVSSQDMAHVGVDISQISIVPSLQFFHLQESITGAQMSVKIFSTGPNIQVAKLHV